MSSFVLVTGASGFIGSHLRRELSRLGRDVLLVTHKTRIQDVGPNEKVIVWEGDPARVRSEVGDEGLDGVVHLATHFVAEHSFEQIPSMIEAIITFGTEMANLASDLSAKWFLNVGTVWQHRGGQPNEAANLYAAAKNGFEQILHFYENSRKLDIGHLYIGDTYGPEDPRKKLLNVWRDAASSGIAVEMTPGFQSIALLHVDDVVSAITAVVEGLETEDPRFIGSRLTAQADVMLTVRELAEIFREEVCSDLDLRWGAKPYRFGGDTTAGALYPRVPDWSPKRSLRDGIRDAFTAR